MHIEYFTFNAFQERCCLVWDKDRNCVIIDPGFYNPEERERLYSSIDGKGLEVKAVLLTHGHFDHIFGAAEAAKHFNVPVYMHPADKVIIDEANPALCQAFGLKTPESFFGTSHLASDSNVTDAVSECSISPNSCGTSHQASDSDVTDAASECSISPNSCGTSLLASGSDVTDAVSECSISPNSCGTSLLASDSDVTDAASECSISPNSCGTSHQASGSDVTDAVSECSISPNSCGTSHSVRHIKEGDRIKVGSLTFEVIETPGHTPGGVCYLERNEKVLFSGDTLFAGSIGRTDNQWADYDSLMGGIFGKLMELDGDIRVIPGHGPDTDIATERTTNPFLMPFNEPFES